MSEIPFLLGNSSRISPLFRVGEKAYSVFILGFFNLVMKADVQLYYFVMDAALWKRILNFKI